MAYAPVERSGIIVDDATGESYLPATQRPDGSWRKPRKVKDGYIPQEEMPTYENKGVQWLKSKPSLPPGLSPVETEAPKAPAQEITDQNLSKAAKKNLKRKEKKKQQQSSQPPPLQQQKQQQGVQTVTQALANTKLSTGSETGTKAKDTKQSESISNNMVNAQSEKHQEATKKIRNLRKKLKQIQDLEARISSGELKEPQKDQLEKISKKKAIEDEMEDLELDLDDD